MNLAKYRVKLELINEVDVLSFFVGSDTYPQGLRVNLNSPDGQNDLAKVFAVALKELEDKPFEFVLEISDGYAKGLYKDVCSEYIACLNVEIAKVYEKLQKELGKATEQLLFL